MVWCKVSLEKFLIRGNLNSHVVYTQSDFESEHDGFGYGTKNLEGRVYLDFAQAYDLLVVNTWYRMCAIW